jgi:hypothetical protein
MAAPAGFLSRMGTALIEAVSFMRPTPIRQASPEDDTSPAPLAGMISRPTDVLALGGPYMKMLAINEDTVLKQEGEQSLRLFDALLDDDVAMSTFQQRRLAVVSRDWEVEPGDDKDPRSVKAADDFRAMLKAVGFDRVTNLLLFASWYGYGVAEGIYTTKQHDGRLIYWIDDIVVPDRKWFGFTLEGELRFIGNLATIAGEEVPPNKFLTIRTGGTHDFSFYGLGLAHWIYWPVWFKRASMRFWALYLEKLSQPTVVGEYDETQGEPAKQKMLATLADIGRSSAVVVPKGLAEAINLLEAQRNGVSGATYKDFVTENNEAIMRVVLGQPGTSKATPQGVGSGQSEVHADVKAEIVKADSDLICEGINGTFAKWLTRWNHGEDVAPPRVFRVLDDAEDLNTVATRDATLDGIGIKRTDESVAEVYGEGYERVEEPKPGPGQAIDGKGNVIDLATARGARKAAGPMFNARDPVPLYVRRQLMNGADIVKWAKAQGFTSIVDPKDMHVTILYSKSPVDPFSLGSDDWGGDGKLEVAPGGPRKVEGLGDDGMIVLHFGSDRLRWRHEDMVRSGASHDYPEYLPHVSFATSAEGVDMAEVEPYTGALKFGPEIFEELERDWTPSTLDFGASELEAIDALVAQLCDDANPVFAAMADTMREHLSGVTTAEGARIALLEAWERMPVDRLAKLTALPLLAERASAQAGLDERVTA